MELVVYETFIENIDSRDFPVVGVEMDILRRCNTRSVYRYTVWNFWISFVWNIHPLPNAEDFRRSLKIDRVSKYIM